MAPDRIPLLTRAPGETVATFQSRPVMATGLLRHVNGLAARLPQQGAVINLCRNRYHFMVGLGAALARGLTTLLPPDPLHATVERLREHWPGSSVLLVDGADHESLASTVDIRPLIDGEARNPGIPPDLVAVVAFTSGSTGRSLPQAKTWAMLVTGTAVNLPHYLPRAGPPPVIVATVPGQHMYGLETSVLAPLRGPAQVLDVQPFFPADVAAALESCMPPRVLVSTPAHLRALVGSGQKFPPVARILCATSPLEAELARHVERMFSGELVEIYGCTETGSLAARRAALGAHWRFFPQFSTDQRPDGTWVRADHLPAPVRLPDQIEFRDDGSFMLSGRESDLVKVGGKRSSLTTITQALLTIPGVRDAVVFERPDDPRDGRLAALVVAPELRPDAIRSALLQMVDSVFVPRPILMVSGLPRSDSGKLPRDAVLHAFSSALLQAQAR